MNLNQFGGTTVMEINNLKAVFNLPNAVKAKFDENKKEVIQGLPPHAPQLAFKVDDHHCPTNWKHGSGLASSYFVAIQPEKGMWLDFTSNADYTHDVAVLISVQGVNPIDRESMVEEAMHMRQYKMDCPKHNKPFGADRYCEDCGYKWAPQNYICTTSGKHLWLDGFRADDGVVRQYYFTEQEMKGIAEQVIGSDKKTYSIGMAFYLSKEPKPKPVYNHTRSFNNGGTTLESLGGGLESTSWSVNKGPEKKYLAGGSSRSLKKNKIHPTSCQMSVSKSDAHPVLAMDDQYESLGCEYSLREQDNQHDYNIDSLAASVKNYDIAAGAKINQAVGVDPNNLDYWQPIPSGLIYINYCTQEMAYQILKKGKKDRNKDGEGALAGLILGND